MISPWLRANSHKICTSVNPDFNATRCVANDPTISMLVLTHQWSMRSVLVSQHHSSKFPQCCRRASCRLSTLCECQNPHGQHGEWKWGHMELPFVPRFHWANNCEGECFSEWCPPATASVHQSTQLPDAGSGQDHEPSSETVAALHCLRFWVLPWMFADCEKSRFLDQFHAQCDLCAVASNAVACVKFFSLTTSMEGCKRVPGTCWKCKWSQFRLSDT